MFHIGYKDYSYIRFDSFKIFSQLKAVYIRHINIKKNQIIVEFVRFIKEVNTAVKGSDAFWSFQYFINKPAYFSGDYFIVIYNCNSDYSNTPPFVDIIT